MTGDAEARAADADPTVFHRLGRVLVERKVGGVELGLVFLVLYCAVQTIVLTLITLWAGAGVSVDDAEQLLYLPYVWEGFGGSQPPLFNWINWGAASVFGVGVLTLKLVKYSVLLLGFFSVFGAMRALGFARSTAIAAALVMLTIPQVVWEAQRALAHSIAAFGFAAFALFAFAMLVRTRHPLAYALFGLSCGLVVLAKFNCALLVAAMVGAALTVPEYRRVLASRWIVLSLAMAALPLVPLVVWSLDNSHAVLARVGKFDIDTASGPVAVFFEGQFRLAYAALNFLALPLVLAAVCFAGQRLNPLARVPRGEAEKFLWRTLMIGYVLTAVLVAASGTTAVRDRWLLPLLFLAPIVFVVQAAGLGERGRRVVQALAAFGALTAIVLMPVTWYVHAYGGTGNSRVSYIDYPALLADINADGPFRTLVSNDFWIGNFRLVTDDLVLLNDEIPRFGEWIEEPAAIVWLGKGKPNALIRRLREAGFKPAGEERVLDVRDVDGAPSRWQARIIELERRKTP